MLKALPHDVRELAKDTYDLFKQDPNHATLHFKRLDCDKDLCSVRVKRDYRTVGLVEGGHIYWAWIGTKHDFEKRFKKKK